MNYMTKKQPVDDIDFTYHIILSKGLGELTRKSEKYIIILVDNAIYKIRQRFNNEDDLKDSKQTAFENIFSNWQKFNPEVATSAFAYFTQFMKLSAAEFVNSWNKMRGINDEKQKELSTMSIDRSNDGVGLYNI